MDIKEFHKITDGCIPDSQLREISIKKEDFLFRETKEINNLFFLMEGELSIIKNRQILWQAQKNEFIGISSYYMGEKNYSYSVKVCKDSRLLVITKNDFDKIISENPELNTSLMQLFCKRIDTTLDKVQVFTDYTRKKRILDFMIKTANKSESISVKILNYSASDLADIVHISKYYTQNFLKDLQSKKMIKLQDDGIEIIDFKGLNLLLNMKGIKL